MDLTTFVQNVKDFKPVVEPLQLEPSHNPNKGVHYVLSKTKPTQQNHVKTVTVSKAREVMFDDMTSYFYGFSSDALWVRTFPGIGKSTTAIMFAQQLAEDGYRVLYLMPRHDYWFDVQNNTKTIPDYWYHWVSSAGLTPDGESMCRLNTHTQIWMKKGYPLIEACKSLCGNNGHMAVCPYRKQARVKHKIIAGVHQHLTSGLSITDFDCVIVDEFPFSSMVSHRIIPRKVLDVGASGGVQKLIKQLELLSKTGLTYRGKELLDHIGSFLEQIYKNAVESASWLPQQLGDITLETVDFVKTNYLFEFLTLLLPEYHAWRSGQQDWLSRIIVDKKGLHLLSRKNLWHKLPEKIIILDATGSKDIYQKIFDRDIRVCSPQTERVGKFYQITQRTNGISAIYADGELTRNGKEMVDLVKTIAKKYKKPGVITFKTIRHIFESDFNHVLHFGGNRGTNEFSEAGLDCVIVAGCPSPPDTDLVDIAAAITFDLDDPNSSRIKPFAISDGGVTPLRTVKMCEYQFVDEDGMAYVRPITGFWNHPELQTIYEQLREAELEQAAGRGRSYLTTCDVWLLTAIPINVEIDFLAEKPAQLLDIPDVPIRAWQRLKKADGAISINTIAQMVGVSYPTARKYAQSIVDWSPKYEIMDDPNHHTAGRPAKVLAIIN